MSQQERWQVNSSAAEAYENHLVTHLFTAWATDLTSRAALQPGDRVLDVACGTGVVARMAAQQVGSTGQVVGVDLNAGMLEVARAQADQLGHN